MKNLLVRYRTHPELAPENLAWVRGVFEQLRQDAPLGLHYRVFQTTDGAGFVHLASFEPADGGNPLPAMEAFVRFQAGLRQRCSEAPQALELVLVEAYAPPA